MCSAPATEHLLVTGRVLLRSLGSLAMPPKVSAARRNAPTRGTEGSDLVVTHFARACRERRASTHDLHARPVRSSRVKRVARGAHGSRERFGALQVAIERLNLCSAFFRRGVSREFPMPRWRKRAASSAPHDLIVPRQRCDAGNRDDALRKRDSDGPRKPRARSADRAIDGDVLAGLAPEPTTHVRWRPVGTLGVALPARLVAVARLFATLARGRALAG